MNEQEKRVVSHMISIYCSAKHNNEGELCRDCRQLNEYAHQRFSKCRFGNDKPNCKKCPIHCYKSEMQERICVIMRYSGPRMIYKHPISVIRHLIKSLNG